MTNEKGKHQDMRKIMMMALMSAGATLCGVAGAGDGAASNRTFVYLRPELNSFWHTATNATLTLPILYPTGATRATLTVKGAGYSRTYADITADSFELALPAATQPSDENVYRLTLTFDDGSTRTASLGLVCGFAEGARAHARCLPLVGDSAWKRVLKRGVLPIPHGMTSFSVNGETVDPGLGGGQGWYAIGKVRSGDAYALTLTTDEADYAANLEGLGMGFLWMLR